MTNILSIIFATIFINNYVLSRFLGICPAIGVSAKVETSVGMGMAVVFVVTLASVISYFVDKYILVAFNLAYMRTIVFILVIASLVQIVEMFLRKSVPSLYKALGIYLPLITTNCIVLGVALLNVESGYNLFETVASAIGSTIGFTLVLVLLAAIREKYELVNVPKAFRGVPLALITLGLMSIAFGGFAGVI